MPKSRGRFLRNGPYLERWYMLGASSQVKDSRVLKEDETRGRIGEKRFRLIKKWIQEVNGPFDALFAPYVTGDSVLLDAGCSRGDPDIPSIRRAGFSVGCDVDTTGLRGNTLVCDRVTADLNALPFAEAAFDAIVCKFVVEHLEVPDLVFREFGRILKVGGVLAVLTPNAISPFAMISRLVPYRAKQKLKSRLFGVHEEDTFPVCYRANRADKLDTLIRQAGLRPVRRELQPGMWVFFIFSGWIAMTVRFLEHLEHRIPALRGGCMYILGVWEKPSGTPAKLVRNNAAPTTG